MATSQNSPSKEARNRYKRGRAFEYRIRDHFKGMGFLVLRSAGSHTPVDLIAIPPKDLSKVLGTLYERTQLIQCKRDGKISPADKSELVALARQYGCDALLVSLVANPMGGRKMIVSEEVLV